MCLPSDALLQHLPSYLGFSDLGRRVSLHGCSSKAQPLLLTLDKGYLLTASLPDLQGGIALLGPPAPAQPRLLGLGVGPPGRRLWPRAWGRGIAPDYAEAFDCVDHNKLWKILKEMGIPDHLICLLGSLHVGQEATVRTGHGTTDWFQRGKGVCQGCILSPCLFNFYAEYIMRNAGLDEPQA